LVTVTKLFFAVQAASQVISVKDRTALQIII